MSKRHKPGRKPKDVDEKFVIKCVSFPPCIHDGIVKLAKQKGWSFSKFVSCTIGWEIGYNNIERAYE